MQFHIIAALLFFQLGACTDRNEAAKRGERRGDLSRAPALANTKNDVGAVAERLQTESPLAAYPGFGHDRAADRARYRRQEIAIHRYIARCMHRAGFQHTPTPSVENPKASNAREALAQRWDPNESYRGSLSPERRTQYNLTLYGVPDPNDEGNLWDPRSPTGGGCWGEAMRAIPSVFAAESGLRAQFDAMQRSIARDARVQDAERGWSACMRTHGFSYAAPRSIPTRQDSAAIRGALTPKLERDYRRALEMAPACARAAGLDSIKAAVRVDMEAEFVRAHKNALDRHLDQLQHQQPLVDSLLAEPPQRE